MARIQRRNRCWLSGLLRRSTRRTTRASWPFCAIGSAPLHDAAGRVVAAVSTSAHATRVPRTTLHRGPSSRSFEIALLRLMPNFVPCADHINRALPTGRSPEVDLASFGPDVTFGFELGLEFGFGFELGFGLEFGFGDGEIDHEAESVGQLPCR
jgi:hypothetical protein